MKVLCLTHQPRPRHRGQALIGLLAVSLILFALYFLYLGPRQGKDGEKRPSVVRESLDRAHDVETTSNVQQIQAAVEMYKSENDGKAPASLDELKNSPVARGFPAEMWVDSVTKQPLNYDPTTGKVSSPSVPTQPGVAGQPAVKLPNMQPPLPPEAQ
jgi:hypothetical protein